MIYRLSNRSVIKTIFIVVLVFSLYSCEDTKVEPFIPPVDNDNGKPDDAVEIIDPMEDIYSNNEWISKIREDHPRLFVNKDNYIEIVKNATTDNRQVFEVVKAGVDNLLDKEIIFENIDITSSPDHNIGTRAAEAAFIFIVTEDVKYLNLSKSLLAKIIEYYEIRNLKQLNIDWYSYSRIHTLMTYDWLYNYLSESERNDLGERLFNAIDFMLPSTPRPDFPRENRGGIYGGFYGVQNLEWYLGLTFYNAGINDIKALEILKTGYNSHRQVMDFRKLASGDDGGAASATLAYSLVDYLWAELNFFYTFRSATGYDISSQYVYLANFPNYVYWNILPKMRQFGIGDADHLTNTIDFPILNLFMTQIVHFYADRYPEQASLAKWLINEFYPRSKTIDDRSFPMVRFFMNDKKLQTISAKDPSNNSQPTARFFESMGQFFMKSGDTYASFTVSPYHATHKHYDNNNFMIYKRGFLTLDTGTRPSPGLHLSHYYPRTVAHNCVTIRMPGEVMPNYWNHGAAHGENPNEPFPNDGGQNNFYGTKVVAFDEKEEYVYIASDATRSYNSAKTNQVLRQFVFLTPDNFIVFDRVNSTNKDYLKKWLLHTVHKPVVNGNEFYHDHEDGRLICKTIYPENINLELIGGPGKQFWSDGKNWAIPNKINLDENQYPFLGHWRVEISPKVAKNEDSFLNLIQVGNRANGSVSIPSAKKIEEPGMKGVEFSYNNKDYKVLFKTSGSVGGKISISSNDQVLLNENFSNSVKSQSEKGF